MKETIQQAVADLKQDNFLGFKTNIETALQQKAIDAIDEKRRDIAQNMFDGDEDTIEEGQGSDAKDYKRDEDSEEEDTSYDPVAGKEDEVKGEFTKGAKHKDAPNSEKNQFKSNLKDNKHKGAQSYQKGEGVVKQGSSSKDLKPAKVHN